MIERQLSEKVIGDHLTYEVSSLLTRLLYEGAVIAGGAARFLIHSDQTTTHRPLMVTDYPTDIDVYVLGDVNRLKRCLKHAHSFCSRGEKQVIDQRETNYGGMHIVNWNMDLGKQFVGRTPRNQRGTNLQIIECTDLGTDYTIEDLWKSFDMSCVEAAIKYTGGFSKSLFNNLISDPEKIALGLPWVGVVSDAFVESEKSNISTFSPHEKSRMDSHLFRLDKYSRRGYKFKLKDILHLIEAGHSPHLVVNAAERETAKFLIDSMNAEHLGGVLHG